MDVGVVFKERTKDQGEDDAAQFVREYRVGMEVVVRILHVYADDRAIFPVRGGVHEHDAAPPVVEGFGGTAKPCEWAACGCEGTVGIDQWGAGPREVTNRFKVLQYVISGEVEPWRDALKEADDLFGPVGMGRTKVDFKRGGAKKVPEVLK